MKHNEGYTLIELMVVILVGAIVASAAAAVLLMGMRMHKASTEQAKQQIDARLVLSALEDMASEKEVTVLPNPGEPNADWTVYSYNDESILSPLFSYVAADQAIYVGSATVSPLIAGVEAGAKLDINLLTLTVITNEDGKKYESSVYCRLNTVPETTGENSTEGNDGTQQSSNEVPDTASTIAAFSARSPASEFLSTNWLAISFADQRQNFLRVLEAEEGSTGASLTTGEYFSEWYIGDYAENPGWDASTPWCACFISWALEQCSEDLIGEVPRYAHVDQFMNSFSLGFWRTKDPSPGDIIFFDWDLDGAKIPEHVGVVTAVENGFIHTIEGNADGRVAKRAYEATDSCILGYGVLKWR